MANKSKQRKIKGSKKEVKKLKAGENNKNFENDEILVQKVKYGKNGKVNGQLKATIPSDGTATQLSLVDNEGIEIYTDLSLFMEDEGQYVFESKTSKTKLAVWFDTPPNDSFIRRCLLITISDEEQMDEETTDEVSKSVDDSTLAMEGEETLENINQNTNQSPKPKKQRDNKTGKPESAAGTNLNEHPRFLLKSRESLDSDRLSLSTVKNLFQDRLSRLDAEQ
jgi:hypothetical protein